MEGQVKRFQTLALCASVFVLAFVVRTWTNTWLTDFWGDSYHHWLITRLTLLHGGVYSDYKGLETVWSPLYHYVSMLPMLLSGSSDLRVLHWMNTLFGALACALSTYLAWKLFANRVAAFTAGAVLATMTWHVAFSGMNVTEVFSGVLVVLVVLVVVRDESSKVKRHSSFAIRRLSLVALFFLAVAMPLTRTDLVIYLGIIVVWLWIQKRYVEGIVIVCGVVIALGGWSAWSFFKTGNFLHWFQQYAHNNLHDWILLNEQSPNAAFAFAGYLNRLSPFVLPALWGGVMGAVGISRVEIPHSVRNDKEREWNDNAVRRKNIWLVTALLAGHSLFLIIGYTRGIVPLLTERYLVIDLPLVAVLVSGWVVVLGDWVIRGLGDWTRFLKIRHSQLANFFIACVLIATTFVRFQNEIPELEIRRWGIDPEWQVGNFLYAQVQPGEIVLTDAPVAIYRSGKDVRQFVSSVELGKFGDAQTALKTKKVRWIVTQPVSYDAASGFIPRALYESQTSGNADGLRFELVWKYDPQKTDIQSEVWHVIEDSH